MPGERLLRILGHLAADGDEDVRPQRVCSVAALVTGMSGAGLMLMSGGTNHGSVCSSDARSALVESLQYELGEGPCVDAHEAGHPVLEPDLTAPVRRRWMAFGPPIVDAGVRAVFGFPLRVGAVRMGALNLYRDRPGDMTDDQHADALVMADVAARSVIAWQAGAPPGAIAAELGALPDRHAVVHQATGMVSVQLGVGVADALVRLRAHAFGDGRPLLDVARDVVERRLRLEGTAGPIGR